MPASTSPPSQHELTALCAVLGRPSRVRPPQAAPRRLERQQLPEVPFPGGGKPRPTGRPYG
eukprot:2019316-Alexandrium_andersonii.AAC.1